MGGWEGNRPTDAPTHYDLWLGGGEGGGVAVWRVGMERREGGGLEGGRKERREGSLERWFGVSSPVRRDPGK